MPPAPAPTRRAQHKRTERRQRRLAPAPPRRAGFDLSALPTVARRVSPGLWWAVTGVLLVLTALAVERKITWYLAVDQFGYLTFAHDLIRGSVFHRWPPIEALAADLPARVDVLVQTYVYDGGILYCRYAPGFALLLAGWLELFGDEGVHYLNPTVFIVLLAVSLAFQVRVLRSRWRAMAGVALTILLSSTTFLFFWALTLVRDLPTHLAGLTGLFLLLPAGGRRLSLGRTAAAGVVLGYAVSIRPDAVLYTVPGLLLALLRWRGERAPLRRVGVGLAAGGLGLLLGIAPFLAYNWKATGHPLRPTQGMELQEFLPAASVTAGPTSGAGRIGYPPGAWYGGTATAVQGGGLKLRNLPHVLPLNIADFRREYGDVLLALALVGALVALLQRQTLFVAAVPYTLLALLFFSCWSKPDARYFAGVHVLLPMLIVEGVFGTLDGLRKLWKLRWERLARGLALGFAALLFVAAALIDVPPSRSALATLAQLVPLFVALSALAAATWPNRRVTAIAAPLLALTLVSIAGQRAWAGLRTRATFQREEMLRARATFASVVEPGAVVITTEDIGRPAENIQYYSGVAHALYLTDLMRWRMPIARAAELLSRAGLTPYLFLPVAQPGREGLIDSLKKQFRVELAADIPPGEAINYFVAAAFHRGLPLHLYRLVWRDGGERPVPP